MTMNAKFSYCLPIESENVRGHGDSSPVLVSSHFTHHAGSHRGMNSWEKDPRTFYYLSTLVQNVRWPDRGDAWGN